MRERAPKCAGIRGYVGVQMGVPFPKLGVHPPIGVGDLPRLGKAQHAMPNGCTNPPMQGNQGTPKPALLQTFFLPLVFLTATTADTATTAWILGLRVRSLSAVGQKVRTNSNETTVFCTFPGISPVSPCIAGPVTGLSQNMRH